MTRVAGTCPTISHTVRCKYTLLLMAILTQELGRIQTVSRGVQGARVLLLI